MRTIERKIIVVGGSGSGKTAIVQRYVNDSFTEAYRPTGGAVPMKKTLEHGGNVVKLVIWDLAGHIMDFHHAYSTDADGVLLVCDINRPDRADILNRWLDLVSEKLGDVPLLVAANKSDIAGPPECMDGLPKELEVIKTSAKTGENVDRLFTELVARMV